MGRESKMAANPTDDAEPHDTSFEDLMKPRDRFPQELAGNVPAQQGNHKFPCGGALLRPKAPENTMSSLQDNMIVQLVSGLILVVHDCKHSFKYNLRLVWRAM